MGTVVALLASWLVWPDYTSTGILTTQAGALRAAQQLIRRCGGGGPCSCCTGWVGGCVALRLLHRTCGTSVAHGSSPPGSACQPARLVSHRRLGGVPLLSMPWPATPPHRGCTAFSNPPGSTPDLHSSTLTATTRACRMTDEVLAAARERRPPSPAGWLEAVESDMLGPLTDVEKELGLNVVDRKEVGLDGVGLGGVRWGWGWGGVQCSAVRGAVGWGGVAAHPPRQACGTASLCRQSRCRLSCHRWLGLPP